MLDRFKKKREITDLEKTEIVIEYLKEEIQIYQNTIGDSEPPAGSWLENLLHYEERKHYFMTRKPDEPK